VISAHNFFRISIVLNIFDLIPSSNHFSKNSLGTAIFNHFKSVFLIASYQDFVSFAIS
jgi:hypothetical protein